MQHLKLRHRFNLKRTRKICIITSQIVITVQLLLCKDCQKHSVHLGSTTKFLSDINNHKLHQGAHLDVRLSVEYGERDLFRYYNSLGHHELNDISVQVIDRMTYKQALQDQEGQWTYRLHTIGPQE